ncbi:hypothetical protein BV25DRAFT_1364699 [Artomyces pyxidatus]|uniref:Uncharacterized protein n=1 Tax=Artomyces pyxidatus TaxID=48021 RepID=A0ACB8SLV5_9AGAM|nr:hypothetical protein BV25DRAFT_1364699 [Artomyces pyxidatus]
MAISLFQDIASSSFSGLPKLRHLTLRTVFGFESPSRSFSTWICAVIASSQLKEQRIISWDSTVWTSNSNLTDIVATQPSLHELAIPECILWCRDFSTIVTGCPVLRHVSFLVTPSHVDVRNAFSDFIACSLLYTRCSPSPARDAVV